MSKKKDKNKEPTDSPPASSEPLPAPVKGFILWDMGAPPAIVHEDRKDGEAWLGRHVEKSGEQPADVRLLSVKEVDLALKDLEQRKK